MRGTPHIIVRRPGIKVLTAGLLISLSGCASLPGHWSGNEVNPESARSRFRLLTPGEESGKLIRADVQLQQNGDYTAELIYDEGVERSSGKWALESPSYLTFVDENQKSYGYAVRHLDEQTIRLARRYQGIDTSLTLNRQAH